MNWNRVQIRSSKKQTDETDRQTELWQQCILCGLLTCFNVSVVTFPHRWTIKFHVVLYQVCIHWILMHWFYIVLFWTTLKDTLHYYSFYTWRPTEWQKWGCVCAIGANSQCLSISISTLNQALNGSVHPLLNSLQLPCPMCRKSPKIWSIHPQTSQ